MAEKAKIVEYIEKGLKTREIQLLTSPSENMIRTIKQNKDYQTANDYWDKILWYLKMHECRYQGVS